MVATVRGELTPDRLGTTLMHEHVFVVNPDVAANFATVWDEEAGVANAIRRLNELHAAGVDTIVDLTVVGLGRCIPRVQRVAAATIAINNNGCRTAERRARVIGPAVTVNLRGHARHFVEAAFQKQTACPMFMLAWSVAGTASNKHDLSRVRREHTSRD